MIIVSADGYTAFCGITVSTQPPGGEMIVPGRGDGDPARPQLPLIPLSQMWRIR
jgi:hypothetical protein